MPLLLDIFEKALRGDAIPAMLLGGYCAFGAVIYWVYGLRHSQLAGRTYGRQTNELSQESV